MRLQGLPALTALGAFLLLSGCDGAPVAPDESLGVLGRDADGVVVPMQLQASMFWSVPGATPAACPGLIDPSTGELFVAEGSGGGHATGLGQFTIAKLDHPTINLCAIFPPNPPFPTDEDTTRSGELEFVAADGSAIHGTYTFFLAPPGREDETFATIFIARGSGRFEGATGTLHADFARSGAVTCDDPLCLTGATLDPAVFEGTVTLPRP